MASVSDRRVRLLRQAAQLLHRPRARPAADVVHHLVGVQAQDRLAFPLAIRARTPTATATDVEAALIKERSIVRTSLMRGTLHVVATEDLGWLLPLTSERTRLHVERRLGQLGVTEPSRALRLMEKMLAGGPMTRAEIAERLARRGVRTEGQAIAHLVGLSALDGLTCYGPVRGGKPTVVLIRDWLGSLRPMDRDAALAELAARYLAAHAPAGPQDLAAWSGLRAADVRRGWEAMTGRLVEVNTSRGPLWAPKRTRAEPPHGVVRLVPAFDEYLLGWKGRDLIVATANATTVAPGGGMIRPAVIGDGVVSGTWATGRARDGVVVRVRRFGRTPSRSALETEAHDVGRFRGTSAMLDFDEEGA
jgi:hypothetical protein